MRERLLGYLFGQLDANERREVEEALANDERLRKELDCLRKCVSDEVLRDNGGESEPWESGGLSKSQSGVTDSFDHGIKGSPPEGLAERTCRHVAITTWSAGSLAPTDIALEGRGSNPARWRFTDLTVAVGVALAAAALLLPAMQQSRHTARRTACQNNLRYLGQGVLQYSKLHCGQVPQVPAKGKDAAGGIFAVELADSGVIDRESLRALLVCPSSRLASQLRKHRIVLRVPTRKQLLAAEGRRLAILQRLMGGSYAYRVGYMDGGRYCVVRIRQSGRVPLLADAPSLHLADFQSNNHGGCGQNVLFDDGRVAYLQFCTANNCDDKIFVNHRGYRAAGVDRDDAVLVPSDVGPAIEFISFEKPMPLRAQPMPRVGFTR